MDDVLSQLVSRLLPDSIRLHFELSSIEETSHSIVLRLEEYAGLVPSEMEGLDNIVLDGFCDPVELLHYSIRDKPQYLRLYRRRWKQSGGTKHSNSRYDLHPEGVKATYSFASS